MTAATAQLCGRRWPDQPYHVPHRCEEPADHPAPCRCRCGATTERSTTDA